MAAAMVGAMPARMTRQSGSTATTSTPTMVSATVLPRVPRPRLGEPRRGGGRRAEARAGGGRERAVARRAISPHPIDGNEGDDERGQSRSDHAGAAAEIGGFRGARHLAAPDEREAALDRGIFLTCRGKAQHVAAALARAIDQPEQIVERAAPGELADLGQQAGAA